MDSQPPGSFASAPRASLLLLLLLALAACETPVGVRQTGFAPIYRELSDNVLDSGKLSALSRQSLAYVGLDRLYTDDPAAAIERFEQQARKERQRGPFVSLSEMHYELALRSGDKQRFLASAISAYRYLFAPDLEPGPDPYSARFRLACDLYNRSLAQALCDGDEFELRDGVFETSSGRVTIHSTRPGFPWDERAFDRFLPADSFAIRGLRERVRVAGLGVPLIAVETGELRSAALTKLAGGTIELPATAFLRLEGGLAAPESGELAASLELYLTLDNSAVRIGEQDVPLEADLTAPLAHMLEQPFLWGSVRRFRQGGSRADSSGIFMLQPYQPGKIPVVLIHGTASSPAYWAQALNSLLADPLLRSRCQFWMSQYNTGNPVLYSAALQRQALTELVYELDPGGSDPALSSMVLIGHSQGGLLARLLVSESGERFWSNVTDKPFEQYDLPAEARELLQAAMFFEPLPFVERVVFVSTPHRGSFLAESWIGRLSRKLVSLPGEITRTLMNPTLQRGLPPELRESAPTSVDNMDPDSPFTRALSGLPFPPGLHLHSIISVAGSGPVEDGDDGVVACASAHLEQADSEFIVRHGHSCQEEPETIGELRRILREHIQALGAAVPEPATHP